MAGKRSNGEGSIRKTKSGSWRGEIMDGYTPDGKKNMIKIVDEMEEVIQNKSLAELCESTSSVSCMAVPRRQEIFACFDRYRALRLV